MRYVVATFDDVEEKESAERALRDAEFEPRAPYTDDPFFDPTTTVPEGRGLVWGGVLGGLLGAVLLSAASQDASWIPRLSPVMTAGEHVLVLLGLGLGAAVGSFLGGSVGTFQEPPVLDAPRVAVLVPDHRAGDATAILDERGATIVANTVPYHDHPLRGRVADSDQGDGGG